MNPIVPAIALLFLLLLFSPGCRQTPTQPQPEAARSVQNEEPLSPDVQYGALFDTVQMARIFPDGKTFADCTPKYAPEEIMRKFESARNQSGFDLRQFVLDNFDPPVPHSTNFKSDMSRDVTGHIMALWPVLTRQADTAGRTGTLLPLPNPYVVPGGRFGEIYYWDSYFTMLGLQVSNQHDLIGNMVQNFAYLIDTYGHIPNGNRSYYLSRSQPPFFSLMVKLTAGPPPPPHEGGGTTAPPPATGEEAKPKAPSPPLMGGPGGAAVLRYLPQLEKEYAFWMDGSENLTAQQPTYRRVVRLDDGLILNRYWDDRAAPRPEAYREDVMTARAATGRPKEEVYRHLKAAAESGIDFSSRWNITGMDLTTINTTDWLPVDLNCLLWHLEHTLQEAWQAKGDSAKTQFYRQRADARAQAIRTLFYDAGSSWFMDYNYVQKKPNTVPCLTGLYPLYFNLAGQVQADACARTVEKTFLRPGGVVTTPNRTGQQWDAPNGWAPLVWITIDGLRRNGHRDLANTIKQRWIKLNTDVYKRTGKLLEKYNVEDLSLEAGGGEYPVQDGFGWTNGVLLRLLSEKE
jgi:alpha,alpha-trehalase